MAATDGDTAAAAEVKIEVKQQPQPSQRQLTDSPLTIVTARISSKDAAPITFYPQYVTCVFFLTDPDDSEKLRGRYRNFITTLAHAIQTRRGVSTGRVQPSSSGNGKVAPRTAASSSGGGGGGDDEVESSRLVDEPCQDMTYRPLIENCDDSDADNDSDEDDSSCCREAPMLLTPRLVATLDALQVCHDLAHATPASARFSVQDDLQLRMHLRNVYDQSTIDKRVEHICELVTLTDEGRRKHSEQYRTVLRLLACAYADAPSVLLCHGLFECLEFLTDCVRLVVTPLRRLAAEGCNVVCTTSDSRAMSWSVLSQFDELVIVSHGRLLFKGTPAQARAQFLSPLSKSTTAAPSVYSLFEQVTRDIAVAYTSPAATATASATDASASAIKVFNSDQVVPAAAASGSDVRPAQTFMKVDYSIIDDVLHDPQYGRRRCALDTLMLYDLKYMYRNTNLMLTFCFVCMLVLVLGLGFAWAGISIPTDEPTTAEQVTNLYGLQTWLLIVAMGSAQYLIQNPLIRAHVIQQHVRDGSFDMRLYLLATTLMAVAELVVWMLFVVSISAWLTAMPHGARNFMVQYCVLLSVAFYHYALGIATVALSWTRRTNAVMIYAALLALIWMDGPVALQVVPTRLRWAHVLDYLYYALQIIAGEHYSTGGSGGNSYFAFKLPVPPVESALLFTVIAIQVVLLIGPAIATIRDTCCGGWRFNRNQHYLKMII